MRPFVCFQVGIAGKAPTMSQEKKQEELTPEELEEQNGEQLPDREVMSTVDPSPSPFVKWDPGATLPIEPNPTE